MTARPVRLVVADDHPLVLRGLCDLIRAEPGMEIAAVCEDGQAALAAVRACDPDIALLDMSMPKLGGRGVLEALVAEGARARVVFLSASMEDDDIEAAVSGGACGIVLKDTAPEMLLLCLREVAEGRTFFPREVVDAALDRERRRREEGRRFAGPLTQREREITLLVAEGLSNKEIARKLNLTEGTVKIHLHNVYQKVDVFKRSRLASLAKLHEAQLRERR